jgi:hypothetical protein
MLGAVYVTELSDQQWLHCSTRCRVKLRPLERGHDHVSNVHGSRNVAQISLAWLMVSMKDTQEVSRWRADKATPSTRKQPGASATSRLMEWEAFCQTICPIFPA